MSQVFLFAFTAALNPTLLAATTVMLLLPRPKRLLLGYLLGAYTTSVTSGLVVVYWLSGSSAVSSTKHTLSPALDILLGALALVIAAVIGTGRLARASERRKEKRADMPKKTPRWQQHLSGGSTRSAFVVGLLLSFPGASYLASLAAIERQDLADAAIVMTVIAVTAVMLILLELPLLSYAVAPNWTPVAVEHAKGWLSRHGPRVAVIAASAVGVLLIIRGTAALLA